ncbi:MAG: hypothetical protein HN913_05170 [Candidatus Marinimicrobia bacterium]|jgi:acyl-CoA synthetase (AMP-forming)/AMP-acid ligase II|nr:hypothetical protein [Candidatus Neomarinimicrobiota bacterium]MBT3732960.1 hypothetical protein [Candidatus Neomarinimicrobiota bacterium]MBT4143870.1 hypothetical protein [Candidatus Neomarinimicrobiota bacterium]MBT4178194.1 hypothetical protein [Candidatus Neomarinimicrobiota bacterium]MBT4593302.1 hypothetical protein [Candidatus Neomarinimicrobiota bacterium]
MNNKLKNRIYQAQCYGNVEPIEYMTPYPNIAAVIEGQNIKYADLIIHEASGMTNHDFYAKVQQTSHWLESLGLKTEERVFLPSLPFPQGEILAFGIWHFGASLVLSSSEWEERTLSESECKNIIPKELDLFETVSSFPKEYNPKHKANLDDEAVIYWTKNGHGIQLSQYNILANVNGVQYFLNLLGEEKIYTDLKSDSMEWLVFQTILPLYAHSLFTDKNPNCLIGRKNQFNNQNFTLMEDLSRFSKYTDTDILISPENTCALSLGQDPLHMTNITENADSLCIEGHSVMMGYLDESLNEKSFHDNALHLKKSER